MSTTDWRLVAEAADPADARPGAWNMAVDDVLLESVHAGGPPVLRLYTWSPPCLSLGRNQPARGRFDARLAADLGLDIVRRPTGGEAVLHHLEITYCVAVPGGVLGGPRATYTLINRALVNGLARLGVRASTARASPRPASLPAGRSAVLTAGPCFQVAAEGEVVVLGRKLVGSAQRYERRVILQHGSVLLDGDQRAVLRLQGREPEAVTGSVTLRDVLGRAPEPRVVQDALIAGFRDAFGIRLAPAPLSHAERGHAVRRAAHYRSEAWTWRR